jgi:hypothetical protein
MRTTPAHDNVVDLNALLRPGTVFSQPREVVRLGDRVLSSVTLAGRTKAPVHIDEILEALRALDGNGPRNPPGGKLMRLRWAERRAAA